LPRNKTMSEIDNIWLYTVSWRLGGLFAGSSIVRIVCFSSSISTVQWLMWNINYLWLH
jgi:hypothetical protein